MYKVINIGEKAVPMLSMASANIYYKRVFHEDPLVLMNDADSSAADYIRFGMQMGYIMAVMAEAKGDRAKLNAMSEDGYAEWLDGFDNGAMISASADAAALYVGQNIPTSKEKKEDT